MMRIFFRRLIAIGLVLITAGCSYTVSAQPADSSLEHALASRRAAVLTDGINLSGWFGGWGDYSAEHTATYITAADFQMMHAMGIRYVRFPLDPVLLMQGGVLASNKEEGGKRMNNQIALAMKAA